MEPQVGAHLALKFGARKFYDIRIPCYSELANLNSEGDASSIKLFSYVEENCIGKDLQFKSPFGELPGRPFFHTALIKLVTCVY